MRKATACGLIAALAGLAGVAAGQGVPEFEGCSRAKTGIARPGLRDPVGECLACDAAELTDVIHCNLDIEAFPASLSLAGTNIFTIKSLSDGLTTFTFRLSSDYAITTALVNGMTPVSVMTVSPTTRVATLDRAYNNGETFTLSIAYSGAPAAGQFSIGFTGPGGVQYIHTQSEPDRAYTWWPCKDADLQAAGDNSDKFTVETAITAPDNLSSVSAGLLQGVDVLSGARKRFRWASGYPLSTYLVFFAAAPFNQWQQTYSYPLAGGGTGTMPVHFSIFPGNDTPANRAAWEKSLAMMEAFRPIFGEYPFIQEKYGVYDGGGMEHQTYSTVGAFYDDIIAHELAHQWWGDMVTCRTWNDSWLNEGFATYAEALWAERQPGSTGLPALIAAMNSRRPMLAGTVYGSMFDVTQTYRKGAWVLHMLRHLVGDATFFNILGVWRQVYQGSAATTADFAAVASSVYGHDLSWFFQQWVYGPGMPFYTYGFQNVTINGQPYLRLRLHQNVSTNSPLFTMPVDLRVNFAGGTNQPFTVPNSAADQWYVLPVTSAGTGITIDQSWMLMFSPFNQAYANGPPKIVQAAPAPGQSLATPQSQVKVSFSENVGAGAADFVVTGPGGAVPVSFSYSAVNFTATLTPTAPFGPGHYTVTVRDTIVSSTASIALDGEMPGLLGSSLPSGNGFAGGAALYAFAIAPPSCYANCDNSSVQPILNANDFQCFLNLYAAASPAANCDDSTAEPVLNANDFQCFLNAFAVGCP